MLGCPNGGCLLDFSDKIGTQCVALIPAAMCTWSSTDPTANGVPPSPRTVPPT
jgi:hypothetical protein